MDTVIAALVEYLYAFGLVLLPGWLYLAGLGLILAPLVVMEIGKAVGLIRHRH